MPARRYAALLVVVKRIERIHETHGHSSKEYLKWEKVRACRYVCAYAHPIKIGNRNAVAHVDMQTRMCAPRALRWHDLGGARHQLHRFLYPTLSGISGAQSVLVRTAKRGAGGGEQS